MYHSISPNVQGCRSPYFDIYTRPQVFREHLKVLAREGYQTIALGGLGRKLEEGVRATEKLVVLTFDDGYADFYTEAFPALSALGYGAAVFLPTAYIGDTPRQFNGRACLTWSQVRELRKAGVEFGSHTGTHPQLTRLPAAGVERELRSSKQEIEDRVGDPVALFSYPYAFPEADRTFRRRLREMLVQAGYDVGVSTIVGTADASSDCLFLERLPVNSGDDDAFLSAKLKGGYDWLHAFQLAFKMSDLRARCFQR